MAQVSSKLSQQGSGQQGSGPAGHQSRSVVRGDGVGRDFHCLDANMAGPVGFTTVMSARKWSMEQSKQGYGVAGRVIV